MDRPSRASILCFLTVALMLSQAVLVTLQPAMSSAAAASGGGSSYSSSLYGTGLSGGPVVMDVNTLASFEGTPPSAANMALNITRYLVPAGVNLVFLDIMWGNDANVSTSGTQSFVAGGYSQAVADWLSLGVQYRISTIFFVRQFGYFFSSPSWDQDFLDAYPGAATANANGTTVPLTSCAGCTTSSGWTITSPAVYRQLEDDVKQLAAWYGRYSSWIGLGEGATGDRNYYANIGTAPKSARPWDNGTMYAFANSVFFSRTVDSRGRFLSAPAVTSKVWAEFLNDRPDVVFSNGPALVYPKDNRVSGGGRSGYTVLQRFFVPSGVNLTSFSLLTYARTVGSPSGTLYAAIVQDNSSLLNGRPELGEVIGNSTVGSVGSSYGWAPSSFTNVRLVGGDYYWAAYSTSSKGTDSADYFAVDSDQQSVFSDVYTFTSASGFGHASRQAGGSVLRLQAAGKDLVVYPYLNVGSNQPGGTAYFQVGAAVSANAISFFSSDRGYDPNNVTLSLEYPNGTVLATATASVQAEYGIGTLSYVPLQLSRTVELLPGIRYQVVAGALQGDSYVGSAGGGVTQDYITETADPPSAGYLGQSQWPVFQLAKMTLLPNGVSNYNYLGGTDLFSSPGYVRGSEIALRFRASAAEALTEFQVEVIQARSDPSQLQLSLRADNATGGSHPRALKFGAPLATSSVALSALNATFHGGAPTNTGYYALANFTAFSGSTSLAAGSYYWLVLNVTANDYVVLQRLVEPEHLVYYSAADYSRTWGVPPDGPTDLSFNVVTTGESFDNLVLGTTKYQLGYFAQSFTSPAAVQIKGAWVPVNVGGSNAIVSVRPDGGSDAPSRVTLASGVVGQNATGGSLNYVRFNLPVNVSAGAKYWLVFAAAPCVSSCSQATSVVYNLYSPLAHGSAVDYGGTALHFETSTDGANWVSPKPSAEGDSPFILAASDATIKVYPTKALAAEVTAYETTSTAASPEGPWNTFLNGRESQLMGQLAAMASQYVGRPFYWYTGLPPQVAETAASWSPTRTIFGDSGAGGPIGCPPTATSCGGSSNFWANDATDHVRGILSAPDQSSWLPWSSFGNTLDNRGDLTASDTRTEYLFGFPLTARATLSFSDWSPTVSLAGLLNETQTRYVHSFGGLLSRMVYSGGYYGSSRAAVRVLWLGSSDDGLFPEFLTPAADITYIPQNAADANLTSLGDLRQFDVIVGNLTSPTANLVARMDALVRNGGGWVVTSFGSTPNSQDAVLGLQTGSSAAQTTSTLAITSSGSKLVAPYTSLSFTPYWERYQVSASQGSTAQVVVKDSNGDPVISTNPFGAGRGVLLEQPYARLSQAGGAPMFGGLTFGSPRDSFVSLMIDAIFYAAHKESMLPILWESSYSSAQPWSQYLQFSVDGSPGGPVLLWLSSNDSAASSFDIHLNGTFYGLGRGGWAAIDVRDMKLLASGTGSDVHVTASVPARGWLPVYLVGEPSSAGVVYSTAATTLVTSAGGGLQIATTGPPGASEWLVAYSSSAPTGVTASASALGAFTDATALNASRVGTTCASVLKGGACGAFATADSEGWYYDSSSSLLYVHFKQGSSTMVSVAMAPSGSTTSSSLTGSTTTSPSASTTASRTASSQSTSSTSLASSSSVTSSASESSSSTTTASSGSTSAASTSYTRTWTTTTSTSDPPVTVGGTSYQVSADSSSGAVTAGGSVSAIVRVHALTALAGPVSLVLGALPAGVSGTVQPAAGPGSYAALLTLSTAASVSRGSYPVTLRAISAAGNYSMRYTLYVRDEAVQPPRAVVVVRDIYGVPIAGALVNLSMGEGISMGATTNASGVAEFSPIPAGDFNATVTYMGASATVPGDSTTSPTVTVSLTMSIPVAFTVVLSAVLTAGALLGARVRERRRERAWLGA